MELNVTMVDDMAKKKKLNNHNTFSQYISQDLSFPTKRQQNNHNVVKIKIINCLKTGIRCYFYLIFTKNKSAKIAGKLTKTDFNTQSLTYCGVSGQG